MSKHITYTSILRKHFLKILHNEAIQIATKAEITKSQTIKGLPENIYRKIYALLTREYGKRTNGKQ